jgi:hypothetical protein
VVNVTKYLIYNHPAIPPVGIKVGVWYSLEELKEQFSLEYIVFRFQPTNFGWESVEEIFPKKNKEKEKGRTK